MRRPPRAIRKRRRPDYLVENMAILSSSCYSRIYCWSFVSSEEEMPELASPGLAITSSDLSDEALLELFEWADEVQVNMDPDSVKEFHE